MPGGQGSDHDGHRHEQCGFGQLFARAGCQGWLCAADIDGDGEVSAGGDELAVAASVFKVAVALEVFKQAAAGRLDPGERVRVSPERATPGRRGCPSSPTRQRCPSETWP